MGLALRDNDDREAATRRPLRFLTAGSVDDGKSTLIGRLLLDGRAILADQLDALEARAGGGQPIDLDLVAVDDDVVLLPEGAPGRLHAADRRGSRSKQCLGRA